VAGVDAEVVPPNEGQAALAEFASSPIIAREVMNC
jgi:hypothetical protein